jgi:hypothetical protein
MSKRQRQHQNKARKQVSSIMAAPQIGTVTGFGLSLGKWPETPVEAVVSIIGALGAGLAALLQGPYAVAWALSLVWLLEMLAGLLHELDDGKINWTECRHYVLGKLVVWPGVGAVYITDKALDVGGLTFVAVCVALLFVELAALVKHVGALNPAAGALFESVLAVYRERKGGGGEKEDTAVKKS